MIIDCGCHDGKIWATSCEFVDEEWTGLSTTDSYGNCYKVIEIRCYKCEGTGRKNLEFTDVIETMYRASRNLEETCKRFHRVVDSLEGKT